LVGSISFSVSTSNCSYSRGRGDRGSRIVFFIARKKKENGKEKNCSDHGAKIMEKKFFPCDRMGRITTFDKLIL
jgi:hypothetical protein